MLAQGLASVKTVAISSSKSILFSSQKKPKGCDIEASILVTIYTYGCDKVDITTNMHIYQVQVAEFQQAQSINTSS